MAEKVLTAAFISINGSVLSDHFTSVDVPVEVDLQEATAFGDEWRTRVGGLKDWSATADYNQDYDAGELDAVLWPLLGVSVPLIVRADDAAKSATNPEWTGNVILSSYQPIQGPVGELVTGSISLMGNGPLARATT